LLEACSVLWMCHVTALPSRCEDGTPFHICLAMPDATAVAR